jgi:hypothetical protein
MPVADAPDDDDVRQSYNFAPGYHGLVYRADGPEHGGQHGHKEEEAVAVDAEGATQYKLSSMQWGMFYTLNKTARAEYTRPGAVLDEAQPRLRQQDEDDQLPRRLAHRGPRHVDDDEEEEALHRHRTGLLRVAEEGQPEDSALHQAPRRPADVPRRALGQCAVRR